MVEKAPPLTTGRGLHAWHHTLHNRKAKGADQYEAEHVEYTHRDARLAWDVHQDQTLHLDTYYASVRCDSSPAEP